VDGWKKNVSGRSRPKGQGPERFVEELNNEIMEGWMSGWIELSDRFQKGQCVSNLSGFSEQQHRLK